MQALFTARAEQHLDTLYLYIRDQADATRAARYIQRIIVFCEGLTTFPKRGRMRDDILPGLRVVGFERRVTVAFVITDAVVLIEGIFYGGRNVEAVLSQSAR